MGSSLDGLVECSLPDLPDYLATMELDDNVLGSFLRDGHDTPARRADDPTDTFPEDVSAFANCI